MYGFLSTNSKCKTKQVNRTSLGAINEERVKRFSGGIPAFDAAIITIVSPLITSLTIPRNHPDVGAVMTLVLLR